MPNSRSPPWLFLSEGKGQHRFRQTQELGGAAGEEWLLCEKFPFAVRWKAETSTLRAAQCLGLCPAEIHGSRKVVYLLSVLGSTDTAAGTTGFAWILTGLKLQNTQSLSLKLTRILFKQNKGWGPLCRLLVLQEGKFLIPHIPQQQWNTGLGSSWKYRIHFSARTPNMGKATDACRASEAGFDELVIYPVSSPLCAPVWNPLPGVWNEPSKPEPSAFHPSLSAELCFPVKLGGFCAGQGAPGHDSRYLSLALGDHSICSDHAGASQPLQCHETSKQLQSLELPAVRPMIHILKQ